MSNWERLKEKYLKRKESGPRHDSRRKRQKFTAKDSYEAARNATATAGPVIRKPKAPHPYRNPSGYVRDDGERAGLRRGPAAGAVTASGVSGTAAKTSPTSAVAASMAARTVKAVATAGVATARAGKTTAKTVAMNGRALVVPTTAADFMPAPPKQRTYVSIHDAKVDEILGLRAEGGDGKRRKRKLADLNTDCGRGYLEGLAKGAKVDSDSAVGAAEGMKATMLEVAKAVEADAAPALADGTKAVEVKMVEAGATVIADAVGAADAEERRKRLRKELDILSTVLLTGAGDAWSGDDEQVEKGKTKSKGAATGPVGKGDFKLGMRNGETSKVVNKAATDGRISESAKRKIGKFIALDCEMVGVGPNGIDSALARISVVNFHGSVVMDSYVVPELPVMDYRTHVSGITAKLVDPRNGARPFKEVQREVSELLKDRILVGHALRNDLTCLYLTHPKKLIRDTSRYKPFRQLSKGRSPALKNLARDLLGLEIQTGEHSSVEDARVAMLLYKKVETNSAWQARKEWEAALKSGAPDEERDIE
ncbi:3'-5' exonuclease [Irineochytrium annulatum]|nr:3'-5' exonuclease [Irineochytrium annulatum]